MPKLKLTKTSVDASSAQAAEYIVWDTDLPGFGLRVRPSGAKSFVAVYRAGHGRAGVLRKMTVGRPGEHLTPEQARRRAKELLGAAANGDDPAADRAAARRDLTVGELCDLYLEQGCDLKKASTIATDAGRIERHIKPLLGRKRLRDVCRADIERFLRDVADGKTRADVQTRPKGRAIVRGGKGTASRTVGLLGGIFSFAKNRGLCSGNPVHGIKRYPDRSFERFLSVPELARLGEALRVVEAQGSNAAAIAIIRLLALTGSRKSEISRLRWNEIDLARRCLRLGDSKTGPKVIPLGAPAVKLLASWPENSSEWVFPAARGTKSFQGLAKIWRRVRLAAGLADLRLHDLRHSYASVALARGNALPVIGALLGHADVKTTARYAHLADDPLRIAAGAVATSIAAAMRRMPSTVQKTPPSRARTATALRSTYKRRVR